MDGSPRLRFGFNVTVADRDQALLVALHEFLGVGSPQSTPARRGSWLPTTRLDVSSRLAHRLAVIPFADEYLLPCAKRDQFDRWREQFEVYERRFPTRIGLGSADIATCSNLQAFFGVGSLHVSPRRQPHYDDEVTFVIQRLRDLVEVIVPFMDEHLPESYKRTQYLTWRSALVEYWEHRAKRRRPCTIVGCDEPRRAHGLCRHHLWELHRQ